MGSIISLFVASQEAIFDQVDIPFFWIPSASEFLWPWALGSSVESTDGGAGGDSATTESDQHVPEEFRLVPIARRFVGEDARRHRPADVARRVIADRYLCLFEIHFSDQN